MPSERSFRVERTSKPRQDIISCQFCRQKKLKCDRQHPCSNCASRGNICRHSSRAPSVDRGRDTNGPTLDAKSILSRLQRLEELVGVDTARSAQEPLTAPHQEAEPTRRQSPRHEGGQNDDYTRLDTASIRMQTGVSSGGKINPYPATDQTFEGCQSR